MRIYLTRHGKTEWNEAGKLQGWKDSPLTKEGIENAKQLGNHLKDLHIDCIITSPIKRAADTANYIRGKRSDIPIIVNESLKEMGFGAWEGLEHEAIEKLYGEEHYNFWNKPHLYTPIQGERFEALLERVQKVLDELIRLDYECVMVVTHAAVIKAIYAIIYELPLKKFWSPPFIHDTSLTIIDVVDGKMTIELEADVSHKNI